MTSKGGKLQHHIRYSTIFLGKYLNSFWLSLLGQTNTLDGSLSASRIFMLFYSYIHAKRKNIARFQNFFRWRSVAGVNKKRVAVMQPVFLDANRMVMMDSLFIVRLLQIGVSFLL